MIKYFINKIKFIIKEFPLAVILFLLLTYLSLIPPVWGYDELASVISHLELNDSRFINVYEEYLKQIGITGALAAVITKFILPIIVIPIRWTYALGLSPIYSIARFTFIDWKILRIIFLFFHIIFAIIGYCLIIKSLRFEVKNKSAELFFTSLLLFSFPFIYWTLTLSSYSYHLFCFGLIIYYEQFDMEPGSKIFTKKSLARSIVMFFNYQYLFIVITLIFLDLIRFKKKISKEKIYLNWFLPLIIFAGTLILIITRAKLFSKHTNPAQSVINSIDTNSYNILEHLNSFNSVIKFFSSRIYDIGNYFFNFNSYHQLLNPKYSYLSFISSLFIFTSIILILIKLYYSKSKFLNTLFAFFITSICFYLINLYPFMPSRHSLVLFLPFIIILTILFSKVENRNFKSAFSFILLFISIILLFNKYSITSPALNKISLIKTLKSYKVNRLILKPCEEEPLFYSKELMIYKPLYQCGPMIIEKINVVEPMNFAIYSKNNITFNTAISIIQPFLSKNLSPEHFKLINQVNQIKSILNSTNTVDSVTHTITIIKII